MRQCQATTGRRRPGSARRKAKRACATGVATARHPAAPSLQTSVPRHSSLAVFRGNYVLGDSLATRLGLWAGECRFLSLTYWPSGRRTHAASSPRHCRTQGAEPPGPATCCEIRTLATAPRPGRTASGSLLWRTTSLLRLGLKRSSRRGFGSARPLGTALRGHGRWRCSCSPMWLEWRTVHKPRRRGRHGIVRCSRAWRTWSSQRRCAENRP
jgi:hypothetical protein